MAEKSMGRRDKRKEVRLAKNQRKHQAWIEHKKSQKLKKTFGDVKSKCANKLKRSSPQMDLGVNKSSEELILSEKDEVKLNSFEKDELTSYKAVQRRKAKRAQKTKFEEFLEIDRPNAIISAEEDLELERKLAKKLKVKKGKLRREDDGLDLLINGIPSVLDSLEEEEEVPDAKELHLKKKRKKQKVLDQDLEGDLEVGGSESEETNGLDVAMEETPTEAPSHKKRRKRKSVEYGREENVVEEIGPGIANPEETHDVVVPLETPARAPGSGSSVKYVAPHLRPCATKESEEHTQIRRRIRGLLNRLSESNVESITGEVSSIYLSVGRSVSCQIISEEVLASCSSGPRGNEQYAAVFAAFVAGMACMVGIDFSAKLMASLAKSFENEYSKRDNLSLRNLTLLLSYLCIFGVCSSELIYDFLVTLSKRLKEVDVSTILTILQCCGMKIRADDPAAMKDFILGVQNRVNELKASSGDSQESINGKRMEFMLETILDIKNNKKRPKEDTVQHMRIKKWLQKLRVGDILIRGLKWDKLLDPSKKGQWWLSGDTAVKTENVELVASTIDREVLEAQKMLQLAAAQRMNTDARRAIFCIIMSGDDYIDAFEKLLRLDLPAKQDREIIRVLVECCLQERVFNKYYTILASKLCEHDKNHKFTLQFCLWDHFKELETMQLIRSMHLAKFVAEMVTMFTLSLAVLKTIDFSDPNLLTPKRIMHFRMLFEAVFEYPDNVIWNMFTRIAVSPELETLVSGIEFFLKQYVVKTNKKIANKFKIAKKALSNTEGVLM